MNYTQTELFKDTVCREPSTTMSLREAHPDAERRPRSLFLRRGREAMRDEDLLSIMLRSGVRGCNVTELAGLLLRHYGSLRELAKATAEELIALRMPGLSTGKAVELSAILEIARRITDDCPTAEKPLTEPAHIARFISPYLLDAFQEHLFVMPLDKRCRLIGQRPMIVSQGLADATLIHPREVFRRCIRLCAVHAIVAHNHPSGDPTPSAEDIRATRQLVEASKVIGIRLIDHIIVGSPTSYASLRERNILSFEKE